MTQNAKHTPGPWRVAEEEINLYFQGHIPISTLNRNGQGNWSGLAQVVTFLDGKESAEGVANARLIAAAPDLLAFVESITDASGPYGHLDGAAIVGDAYRLAAKARGVAA